MTSTAIVGAGAAGLSLALMLDGDVTVFEAQDEPGGLCRSVKIEGSTFDHGPHILGGLKHAVDWVLASTDIVWVAGETANSSFIDGGWHAHPFAREEDVARYMRKMWKADDLLPAGLGAQPGRKPGGVSMFRYPRVGGYQAITDVWARRLGARLKLAHKVSLTDLVDDFDRVIWTGPRNDGHYNTLVTATALCYGPRPARTAIYLPDGSTPFHRVSFPASFSPLNCSPDMFLVQAEASYYLEWDFPAVDELLDQLGLGTAATVHYERVPFAYPVPTVALPAEEHGLIFHGRTGAFRYLNVDGVVAHSLALAERLNS